jgi:hypothetical protein
VRRRPLAAGMQIRDTPGGPTWSLTGDGPHIRVQRAAGRMGMAKDGCNRLAGEYCLSPRGSRAVLSDVGSCALSENLRPEHLFRRRTDRESFMSTWLARLNSAESAKAYK